MGGGGDEKFESDLNSKPTTTEKKDKESTNIKTNFCEVHPEIKATGIFYIFPSTIFPMNKTDGLSQCN